MCPIMSEEEIHQLAERQYEKAKRYLQQVAEELSGAGSDIDGIPHPTGNLDNMQLKEILRDYRDAVSAMLMDLLSGASEARRTSRGAERRRIDLEIRKIRYRNTALKSAILDMIPITDAQLHDIIVRLSVLVEKAESKRQELDARLLVAQGLVSKFGFIFSLTGAIASVAGKPF